MDSSIHCVVCQSASSVLAKKANFTLYGCTECGHSFAQPFPSSEELSRYYSGFSWRRPSENLSLEQIDRLSSRGKEILEFLFPSKPNSTSLKVFDYGCGVGLECLAFSRNGSDVFGSDCDQEALSFAKTISPETTFYHQSKIPNNILGTFDLVWSSHVIEHLSHPLELMEATNALLKPGGTLCVLTPNSRSLEFLFRKDLIQNYFMNPKISYSLSSLAKAFSRSWVYLDPPRHLNVFSAESLRILSSEYYQVSSIHSEYSPEAIFNLRNPFNYSIVRFLSLLKIAKNIPPNIVFSVLKLLDRRQIHGDSLVAILKKRFQ